MINMEQFVTDGKFDLPKYMTVLNKEYKRRVMVTHNIKKIKTMEQFMDKWQEYTQGNNFVIEASLNKAVNMPHKALYYVNKEKVFIVVFDEDLKTILENKIKALQGKNGLQQTVS